MNQNIYMENGRHVVVESPDGNIFIGVNPDIEVIFGAFGKDRESAVCGVTCFLLFWVRTYSRCIRPVVGCWLFICVGYSSSNNYILVKIGHTRD